MTKMEKLMTAITLLECVFIGYFKYKATKAIEKKCEKYFGEEAKRVVDRQRQKFYKNETESNHEET